MTVGADSVVCGASWDLEVHLCSRGQGAGVEARREAWKSNRPDVHLETWMDLKTRALRAHKIKLNTHGGS